MPRSIIFQGTATTANPSQLRAFRLHAHGFNAHQISVTPVYLTLWQHSSATTSEQQQQQRLADLLQARSGYKEQSNQLIVLPRFGLQTPWSSKVLDICALCQLQGIEAIEQGFIWSFACAEDKQQYAHLCFDAMTQQAHNQPPPVEDFFARSPAQAMRNISCQQELDDYNTKNGLGLQQAGIDYLRKTFKRLEREPTDAELMMFAQVNSEHCRHLTFNGQWQVDDQESPGSLFQAIKATSAAAPQGIISAYSDNAAVIEGWETEQLQLQPSGEFYFNERLTHHCIKVETHNHPTAIAPWEGAATGIGGEIRDEGATGSGARPKAGMSGFIVADLQLPKLPQPWEQPQPMPNHAQPLEIMISAPLGGCNYGNEFGRPAINGFFRTLDSQYDGTRYASIKPVMIVGGIGRIFDSHARKQSIASSYPLVVLGGASMRVGIGGGSTSSVVSGSSSRQVDFSSVQRDNPEMERRCQQVIDACVEAADNPIAFIHDIGAGGLSNAFPELVHESGLGAQIHLDSVPCDDSSLSPMEIWCNESQERYALAIHPKQLARFEAICRRERCPYACIGESTQEQQLRVISKSVAIVDMPMQSLFGDLPATRIAYHSQTPRATTAFPEPALALAEVLQRIVQCPSVASKDFLITIADRSITGLVAGEQMIGPWQVPVADCALSATGFRGYQAEAMATGERPALAIVNPQASVAIALGELITNLVSCGGASLGRIQISANWMAACQQPSQRQALHQSVQALSDICQQLGVAIPVGKDSLSMESRWQDDKGQQHSAISPMSLVLTGYCRVDDLRQRLTPQLVADQHSQLYYIDLAAGKQRLAFSALAQVQAETAGETPDLESIEKLKSFVSFIAEANKEQLILAYHDRSDGGLWACLCEMAFAGHTGLDIDISLLGDNPLAILANEELGAVIQVSSQHYQALQQLAQDIDLYPIATLNNDQAIVIQHGGTTLFRESVCQLEQLWATTSWHIEQLRDDSNTSQQAFDRLGDWKRTRLIEAPSFAPESYQPPAIILSKPRVAIIREQGSNGHNEMACAFLETGFQVVDVHMSDLAEGTQQLTDFQGLVACGGFSYGDVLGAGTGWASVITYNDRLREQFSDFFARDSSFSLGVCNGCQMLAQLSDLIPGKPALPYFSANDSGRFEGRLSNLLVEKSSSVLLQGMEGSLLVTAIAHGFGKIEADESQLAEVTIRYADQQGKPTTSYPDNPNGSNQAIAGLCSEDGRVTIMMPHPERNFLQHQSGWRSTRNTPLQQRFAPWFRLFVNARKFCG